MPKKYIQTLLSINFCLTAMTAIANPGADITENIIISNEIEINDWTLEDYRNQFNQIWDCLEKINNKYPSALLQNLIAQYKEEIEKPFPYDEPLEEVSATDLDDQIESFNNSLQNARSNYQSEELDELKTQIDQILDYGKEIYDHLFFTTEDMSPKEKAFLHQQLGQLQVFLQNFISPLSTQLNNQFYSIWDCLDQMHAIHPSASLQSCLARHKEDMKKPMHYEENPEEISKEELDNQFSQLGKSLKIFSNYPLAEKISEDDAKQLRSQFDAIKQLAISIYTLYKENVEFLSKEETLFLKHQLEELQSSSQRLINPENSLVIEWKDQFNQIWDCLDKMNVSHSSNLLDFFVLRHKEDTEKSFPYDENLAEISKEDLDKQFDQLSQLFAIYFMNQTKEAIDKPSQEKLIKQSHELDEYEKTIYTTYLSKAKSLSKEEKKFLSCELEKLQGFLQNFISPVVVELSNQFQYIWNRLDKINNIHPSELLQRLILQHQEDMIKLIPYDKNLEEIKTKELDEQFAYLKELLKICSKYQFKEEISRDSEEKLRMQFNAIEHFLGLIQEIYTIERLSKEDKVFLKYRLQELVSFSQDLINFEIKLSPLSEIQELLEACQEEDLSIYAEYEPLINNEEVHSLEFLTDPTTKKSFIYFNKNEGLIEIQHRPEEEEPYSTTWKIGKADMSLMEDWKKFDVITVTKTSLFAKYSMSKYLLGESLEFTLNNKRKKSVRANFVCKSVRENTYTILSIDYLENMVILKNGPCLFIQGSLNNWDIEDTVVLQRTGSALNTKKSHNLINKTRPETVSCSLIKN